MLSDTNSISLKVAKYFNDNKVDLIENEEYGYCSIIKATENILNKLNIENSTKAEITPSLRKENRLVNPTALREAVINAIVHNDYSNEIPPLFEIFSNKIVITSSGGLPQQLTQEEFFEGISAPRNKELMRVFKDIKLVEQLGSGIQRILETYDKNIFKFSTNFLKVSFPIENASKNASKNSSKNASKNSKINNIKLNSTQEEISIKLKKHVSTIQRNMKKLQEKNVISRVGSSTKGYWEIL